MDLGFLLPIKVNEISAKPNPERATKQIPTTTALEYSVTVGTWFELSVDSVTTD